MNNANPSTLTIAHPITKVSNPPNLDEAKCLLEEYLQAEFSLVQLNGKKPFETGWPEKQGLPLDQALKWLESGNNIGMRTGAASGGVYALDVDGEGKDWDDFVELNKEHLKTVRWIKTSEGRGRLLVRDQGWESVATGQNWGEVLGNGHQCVLPPSFHPDTGKSYTWEGDASKALVLAVGPDDLIFTAPLKRVKAEPSDLTEGQHETLKQLRLVLGCEEDHTDKNKEAWFPCPSHPPDKIASFSYNLSTHKFSCFHGDALKGLGLDSLRRKLQPASAAKGVGFRRRVNLGQLQTEVRENPEPAVTFLPLLGQEKFIVKGWSHILAAYPKGGKTELMASVVVEWSNESILWITEEAEDIWRVRMKELPQTFQFTNVELVFGLGMTRAEVLAETKGGSESVVILDTIRNLLGFKDENDNSEVARELIPFVTTARDGGKTLIALHHDKKGGGEHGEGISGAHAFLGVVDVALEIIRSNPRNDHQRMLRGWGRVITIPELIYEQRKEDNSMFAVGSPTEVKLDTVKDRLVVVLGGKWAATADLRNRLSGPLPSPNQLTKALEALSGEGSVERDPPMEEGKVQGKVYKWRAVQQVASIPTKPTSLLTYRGEPCEEKSPEDPEIPTSSFSLSISEKRSCDNKATLNRPLSLVKPQNGASGVGGDCPQEDLWYWTWGMDPE